MKKQKQNEYRTIKIKSDSADIIKKLAKEEGRNIVAVTERLIKQGVRFEEMGLKL